MKLIVLLLLAATIISAVTANTTTNLVSVNSPVANQKLIPNEQVTLQHAILGTAKNIANTKAMSVFNYPSSLDVYFRWTNRNSNQSISLTVASGLPTAPIAGGAKDKVYNYQWKFPNCRFFKRYSPFYWSFTLIFDPQYSDILASRSSNSSNNTKTHQVETLGPKQVAIIIPISIDLNSNEGDDAHQYLKEC